MEKTIKISPESHKELTKIKGELTARAGVEATYSDAVAELLRRAKTK